MPTFIDWETPKESPGPFDTRYARVNDERRFRITHVGPGEADVWEATDLIAPEGDPNAIRRGSYAACVDWCWWRC